MKAVVQLRPGHAAEVRKLFMSPSSQQGKLLQDGTNFHELLDDIRKDLACSYVQQPTRSVTEITFLLGFANTSNFTRAFKRWTGKSPTDFRHPSRRVSHHLVEAWPVLRRNAVRPA